MSETQRDFIINNNSHVDKDDGAIQFYDGSKYWFVNDELHREDGPAVITPNGRKEWHLNGVLHREYGPAIECVNGHKEWWIHGNRQLPPTHNWQEDGF